MSDNRDKGGRFRRGAPSPNPHGRPHGSSRKVRTTYGINSLILDTYNQEVVMPGVEEGRRRMTHIQRAALMVASGKPSARMSGKDVIALARSAASACEHQERLWDEQQRKEAAALAEREGWRAPAQGRFANLTVEQVREILDAYKAQRQAGAQQQQTETDDV